MKLDDLEQTMSTRTAMLWLQYLVSTLQRFIEAERMSNWKLHLQTVHYMLPYFAASGHSRYAKSAYVYLQSMLRLPETHPDAHRKFMEGYHVVRGSDRFLGRIVPRPNHRESAYEKYKDTCRTDKRKGDDREVAFGVGLVHACVHASMRPSNIFAMSHMKPVTSTMMYQQLNNREMSLTPLI